MASGIPWVAVRWRRRGAAFAAECVELVSEIVAVTGRKRFFKKLVNEGQKIKQGADGDKRRRVRSAEVATSGSQQQSIFNKRQGDTTVAKLGG